MRVRVKLMTISNVPASALGDDPEKVIKKARAAVAAVLALQDEDDIYIGEIELVEDDEERKYS